MSKKNRNKNQQNNPQQNQNPPAEQPKPEVQEAPRTRGILLIALGNPEYGKMAWNLLVTIRASDKETPVALVHNNTSLGHLSEVQKTMFSNLIVCPTDYYIHQGKPAYVKPKVYIYDLTPFDDTMFMDCDVAMMPGKKISDMLDELKGIDFTIKNTGRYNIGQKSHEGNAQYGYGGWEIAKLPELAEKYGIKEGHFYQVQGECFWFRKCLQVRALFEVAKRAFTEQKAFIAGGFAGQNMNDELAFIIALAYVGMQPHVMPWTPTWWYLLEPDGKNPNRTQIMGSHWLLSAGGNNVPPVVESFYNDIVGRAAMEQGLRSSFKLKKKSTYLPERKLF